MRTLTTIPALLTTAFVHATAEAQTTIYTCNFDVPPYAVGTVHAQQGWATSEAATIVAVPEMAIVTGGGPGPQSGNGFFRSTNGSSSTTSGRFAFQSFDYPPGGSGTDWPLIKAIKDAEAAGASVIEFSAYITAPTPALSGTQNVGARHGMVLYVVDPSGTNTSQKAACGFQVRAFDRQVFVVQWLDVGQVGIAGNYLLSFTSPLQVAPVGYTHVACRWNRETGMPSIRVGGGEWAEGLATSTIGATAQRFDIVNNRGSSASGATNVVATTAYMDSLVFAATQPAYPQCDPTAGDCDVVHGSAGCNIVTCCETVCNLSEACCNVGWDANCVGIAIQACGLFVYSCGSPNTPVNNCAISPTLLTSLPAILAYDTTSATTDGPPEIGCASPNNDLPIHKDVWYRLRAPTEGTLVASNCSTSVFGGSGNFNSKIAAYDLGTNPAAFDPQLLPYYFIGCGDDCGDPLLTSELTFSPLSAGHYYLIRLGGYEGQGGVGNVYIDVQPPPNPCDPANIISGVRGTNVVAVDPMYGDLNMQPFCSFPVGGQNIVNAKFIKFTPVASGAMTVLNCSDTGPTVDCRLAAMTQCGTVSTTIACDDDGCTGGAAPYTSRIEFGVVAGEPVYIAVGGYNQQAIGPFNIEIVPPWCSGDFNDDGKRNGADLGELLINWGPCGGCAMDLDGNGTVDGGDLALLLADWGPCP